MSLLSLRWDDAYSRLRMIDNEVTNTSHEHPRYHAQASASHDDIAGFLFLGDFAYDVTWISHSAVRRVLNLQKNRIEYYGRSGSSYFQACL